MATKTVSFTFRQDEVLVDATSAKLSSSDGTYGVRREDTEATVVADGTDFTHDGTGLYSYSFEEPAAGLTYRYWIELVYAGRTYHWEKTTVGGDDTTSVSTQDDAPRWLVFSDVYEHLFDFAQGHSTGAPPSAIRRAVHDAYDEVVHAHPWSFCRDTLRVYGEASQTTGTVDYDTSSRVMTLSGATWGSDVGDQGWAVYVDNSLCEVEARLSATTLRMHATRNPRETLSGESYRLFRWWYPLPRDAVAVLEMIAGSGALGVLGREISWTDMEVLHRDSQETGTGPRLWCVGPNPRGGLALYVWPALDEATRIDCPYKARPREIRITGNAAGHIQGTISTSGTAVTGSGTAFTSRMEGSILRIASDTTPPDSLVGDDPYYEEREIASVESATGLTLYSAATTQTDVAYRISDPLSVGRAAWKAVLACGCKNLATMRIPKAAGAGGAEYRQQLTIAREADAAARPRRAGRGVLWPTRLKDMRSE